jgi:hypothetical protein
LNPKTSLAKTAQSVITVGALRVEAVIVIAYVFTLLGRHQQVKVVEGIAVIKRSLVTDQIKVGRNT